MELHKNVLMLSLYFFSLFFSKEKQSKYSLTWLEKNLGQSETGLSGSEFALTIADLLSGSRTSDDLQTELFDLLGFDRIELIQELLEHRREIVDSYHLNKKVSWKKFSTCHKLATDRFRLFVC